MQHARFLRGSLMVAASALAIMVATPEEALAACLPVAPVATDTVTCDPGAYGPLSWAVDDLTVVVGSGVSASTVVGGASNGITMTGTTGSLELSVYHAGSTVSSTNATGIYIYGSGSVVDVTATIEGSVSGGTTGFYGANSGSGALSITTNGVSSTGGDGLVAFAWGDATDITVVANGTSSSSGNGMDVRNWGSGLIDITAHNVYGLNYTGLYAININGSGLSVDVTGTVTSNNHGIGAYNNNAGALDIDAVNVSSGNIGVRGYNSGTNASIDTTGTIYGSWAGIASRNFGSGFQAITTSGTVTGNTAEGIFAVNYGTTQTITASDTVYGGFTGLSIWSYGSGALNINVVDVTADNGTGIQATGAVGSGEMNITATGTVYGSGVGMSVQNNGSNNTYISVVDVTGGANGGISTGNQGGDLTIISTGTVSGGWEGIGAHNSVSGSLTISAASVNGNGAEGIYARNNAGTDDIDIDVSGMVYGRSIGIVATNLGNGSLTIDAVDVDGATGNGIYARNYGTYAAITTTGGVTGGTNGIQVANHGTGSLSVTSYNASGATGTGILASNSGSGSSVTIDGGSYAHGGANGIFVTNSGVGETLVNATVVRGDSTYGIYARGSGTGSNYVAAYGLVDSYGDPVLELINFTTTYNYGPALLDHLGNPLEDAYGNTIYEVLSVNVTPNYGGQIIVPGHTVYSSVTVNSSDQVIGGTTGIWARNDGSGDLSIASVDVYGNSNTGIYGRNEGTNLTIASSSYVRGGITGVHALNNGDGDTNVSVVDVTGDSGRGVYVRGGSSSADMSVASTGTVNGATDGIYAFNTGIGATVVSGNIVNGYSGDGISAYGDGSTGDMLVSALGTVFGSVNGVQARNYGTGSTIVSTADVTGNSSYGVLAYSGTTTTDLLVVTGGTTTGGVDGIHASGFGTGSTIVSAVDVYGQTGHGINVATGAGSTDLLVSVTGTAGGQIDGIRAINNGTGGTIVSAVDVYGTTGRGIHAYGKGTTILDGYGNPVDPAVLVVSTGTVTAQGTGIYLRNEGLGSSLISAVNVSSATGQGIHAQSSASGTSLTVSTSGTIYGYTDGIWACGLGSGGTTVSATGTVTGQTGDGIYACSTITTQAAVYGGVNGINVNHQGTDGVTITATDTVTGGTGAGITVYSPGSATYVDINLSDTVSGYTHGVYVRNLGTGSIDIIATDTLALGASGNAIEARGYGEDMIIVSTGLASGGYRGITAQNFGTGSTTVTALNSSGSWTGFGVANAGVGTENVVATSTGLATSGRIGAFVRNHGTGYLYASIYQAYGSSHYGAYIDSRGTDSTVVSTGYLTSNYTGLVARNFGTGSTTITVEDVTGGTGRGVYAYNAASTTGDMTVTTNGTVYGGIDGIMLINLGSGATTIDAVNVEGNSSDGIYIHSRGADVDIDVTGTLYGGTDGLDVNNLGSGSTTVNVVGATGQTGTGIDVYNDPSAADVSITATATVYGGSRGIEVFNRGTGNTTIEVVDVTGQSSRGISTDTYGVDVTINATDTVYGGDLGIRASHFGTGSIDIDAVDVTGQSIQGLTASNSAAGQNITIDTTGTVYGGTTGMFVSNDGMGSTDINAVDVTGASLHGIYARAAATTTTLNVITTGTIYGGGDGINACGLGSGGTYIHAYGTVTGQSGTGIYTCSTVITEMAVYGGTLGIHVDHVGADGVNITSNSTVTGGSGIGIFVENSNAGTYVDIDANDTVYGGNTGMGVLNFGSGSLTINATDVTGNNSDGIRAYNLGSGPETTVTTTGTVSGHNSGIIAVNVAGAGAVTVNAYNVYGTDTGTGVGAINFGGTDVNVTVTGGLTGFQDGVYTNNSGFGDTTINVVTASGYLSNGIQAYHDASAGAMSITATGHVDGGNTGIVSSNLGSGATTINATSIHGGTRGIYASNAATTGLLSVTTTGTVYGGQDGIWACGLGTGGTYIHTYGTVTGQSGIGIYACSTIIAEDDVYGGTHGILANHQGSDGLTIEAVDVTGQTGTGIVAYNNVGGTSIDVTSTGYVYGAVNGIYTSNLGSGITTVNAVDVTGNNFDGIHVRDYGTGVSVTTTGHVEGGDGGIYAYGFGTGNIVVNANSTTGGSSIGIYAHGGVGTSDMTITTTGLTSGGFAGISVDHRGSNSAYITPTGNVHGGSYGILTIVDEGAVVTIASGVSVDGSTAISTRNGTGGFADDTVNTGGIILGNIFMWDGNDELNFTGGSITGLINMGNNDDTVNWSDGTLTGQMLGGDDYDTINIALAGGGTWIPTGTGADLIDEFEELNFLSGGWTVDGGNQVGYDLIQFHSGTNAFGGALVAGQLGNLNGSTLLVANGSSVSGNLVNSGTMFIGAGTTADMSVGGNFTQTGTGIFYADVFGPGDADLLTVSGGVSVAGTLIVDQGAAPFEGTTTLIDGGTSLAGAFGSVYGIIPGGLLFSQAIDYDAALFDVNLVTTVVDANALDGLNQNQGNVANGVVRILFDPNVDPDMYDFALSLINLTDVQDIADVADELYPGVMDAAVAITDGGIRRFSRELLNESRGQGAGELRLVDEGGHIWWAHSGAAAESMAANKHRFTNYETHALDLAFGIDGFEWGEASFGAAVGYSGALGTTSTGKPDNANIRMAMVGAYGRAPFELPGSGINARLDGSLAWGTATGTIERHVVSDIIDIDELFREDYDATELQGEMRFSLNGRDGDRWLLRPLAVLGGSVTHTANNFRNDSGVSALYIDGTTQQRGYIGAGLELFQQWDTNKWMMLRTTGFGYFGDNQNVFNSEFANAAPGTTDFRTLGAPLNSVMLFEGGFGYTFGSRFFMGLEAFAEVGDRESTGGSFHVSTSF